jgi:hypothetical protein
MPTHRHLTTEHQQTLLRIFEHHATQPIEWAELLHLIESVGNVVEEEHGRYRFTVNGEHHVFARPRHDKITNADELVDLRKMLERARMTP